MSKGREIVILGLAREMANANAIKGEIWTLNDFYVPAVYGVHPPFPKFKPHYIFQVHKNEPSKAWLNKMRKNGRWLGDWKDIYNRFSKEVITINEIEGLTNQKIFDIERAQKEFGSWCLTSTCSYMLIQAVWEGVDYIRLNGLPMIDEGYSYQMPGTHLLIEKLRGMGILIHNPFEAIWDQMLKGFNWQELIKSERVYGRDKFKIKDLYHKDANKPQIVRLKNNKANPKGEQHVSK